jgi:heat shock protein HslJ
MAVLVVASACAKKNGSQGEHAATQSSSSTASGDTIGRRPWRWIYTVTPAGRVVCINPDVYKLTFFPDSTVRLLVDCNRGSGPYHAMGHDIRIGPFATTRAMCPPGSMDTTFVKHIQSAHTWNITADTLDLGFASGGSMRLVH